MWSHKWTFWKKSTVTWLLCLTTWASITKAQTVLEAHLSQHSVRGVIKFTQSTPGDVVSIEASLSVAREYKGEYSWGIYPFPIDYSTEDFCHSRMLGRKPTYNFDTSLNKLPLDEAEVTDESIIRVSDLRYTTSSFNLTGLNAVWGHALVLEGPSRSRVCGSLMPTEAETRLKSAEARFTSPVGGSIWFTSLSLGSKVETKIYTNLVHVAGRAKSSSHKWQLFITDVLDTDSDIQGSGCDFLQILYDPNNDQGEGCSEDEPQKCREGDLTGKFGQIKVSRRESMFTKSYFHDNHLELPELDGSARSLFVVVYDEEAPDHYLACAKVRDIKTKVGEAKLGHEGLKGDISISQISPFFPAKVQVNLDGLQKKAGSYHIHEYPTTYDKRDNEDNPCSRTGGHYNPFRIDPTTSPKGGSSDKYEVGDLSGKHGALKELDSFSHSAVDPLLSLFGKFSVIGRSIVIHQYPRPTRWTCANIILKGQPLMTGVATFTYPVAGRIIFRQPQNDPYADTSIFVESLIYSDGSKNDSRDHKWHVHTNIPGRDFFNWTGRCLSSGGHFNPYQIDKDPQMYSECSNEHIPYRCEVGDLVNKHDRLAVSGRKRDLKNSVKFFTDSNLPLSGRYSIIGRSITIHDDFAPEHRGNRMACTGIYRAYRHKAVATSWFGNGQAIPVKGRLEFLQASPMDTTHVLVDLHGLNGVANAYHVHQVLV